MNIFIEIDRLNIYTRNIYIVAKNDGQTSYSNLFRQVKGKKKTISFF